MFVLLLILLFRASAPCWSAVIRGWWTLDILWGAWKAVFQLHWILPCHFLSGEKRFQMGEKKISNDPGTSSCFPLETGNCWLLQICLRLENLQLAETSLRLMVKSLRLSVCWWIDEGLQWVSMCRCLSAHFLEPKSVYSGSWSSKISHKAYIVMGVRVAKSGLKKTDRNDAFHLKKAWHNVKKGNHK